jgi:DNA-binding CsgD family transcriptional regulator
MARRTPLNPVSWKAVLAYGVTLAAGAALLDWVQFQRFARARTGDVYLGLVAAGFLLLGIWVGARLLGHRMPPAGDGNPAARASLGISDRELAVLKALAGGRSNREIAAAFHISPHTVKTHVARLYEKLGARRRTDAVARARALGILS